MLQKIYYECEYCGKEGTQQEIQECENNHIEEMLGNIILLDSSFKKVFFENFDNCYYLYVETCEDLKKLIDFIGKNDLFYYTSFNEDHINIYRGWYRWNNSKEEFESVEGVVKELILLQGQLTEFRNK